MDWVDYMPHADKGGMLGRPNVPQGRNVKIRVVVADDHPVLLAGLEQLLQAAPGLEVVGLVRDSSGLVELLGRQCVDVVVTDYSMPHGEFGDGSTLLRFLRRRFPQLNVVVLTGMESPLVLSGIRAAGVDCVISKADPGQHLVPAIHAAMSRRPYVSPEVERLLGDAPAAQEEGVCLSKRESEVLRMFAEGLSVIEIAARINRSRKTVSTQKIAAMRKLGLENDADVFRYAIANGLVPASQLARGRRSESD